jgi:CRP-like cAMP-binding protein
MDNFISVIQNIDLFKFIKPDDLKNLFKNGSYISLDIILQGTVAVQKIDSSGNVLNIYDFTIGEVLGGNLIFSKKNKYPMTLITKTYSEILHIKRSLILELCKSNINFLKEFLSLLSDKTLMLTEKIKSLTMKTIRQCIIEFLLYETYSQKSATIKLNISKKDLAERFGVQRTSLSRELNKMRQDNLISYNANYITILDLDLLKKLHIDT